MILIWSLVLGPCFFFHGYGSQDGSQEISPTDALGLGFPPVGSWGNLHAVEDGPADGGPSQTTAYRLGRCWLLPW